MPGRYGTVYDLTSLQIHADGTLISQDSRRNQTIRHVTNTVRDSRGNWIAGDAAGRFLKLKEKKGKKRKAEVEADEDGEEIHVQEDGEQEDEDETPERTVPNGIRRKKKRKIFKEDLWFLDDRNPSSEPSSMPLPSSDLLKAIHHVASKYYGDRGMMLNATQQYREKRAARKKAKQVLKEGQKPKGPSAPDEDEDMEKGESEDEDEEHDDAERVPRQGNVRYQQDMYKVMDGSALVAIGMLLQHHVISLLKPRIPDGWEEQMLEAGAPVEEDEDTLEDEEDGLEDDDEEEEGADEDEDNGDENEEGFYEDDVEPLDDDDSG